jgi:ubiquinone/menaquinone biosynthesis C-methylase UbiE
MEIIIDNSKSVNKTDLENKIKAMYKKVAEKPNDTYHFEMGRALAERLGYDPYILDLIPAEAIDSFAGVGHYFDFADLKYGESVVDFGSGSGMDAFYAAEKVGKNGKVIGIDMTLEQLKKAIELKHKSDYNQVNFIESYIEKIPLSSNTFDVATSNGVINLSREKEAVFIEMGRVLKPGGRLVISDIVSTKGFPSDITCNPTLWAACVAGAMQVDIYLNLIKSTGFEIIKVKENPYAFISDMAKGATRNYGIQSISLLAIKQ